MAARQVWASFDPGLGRDFDGDDWSGPGLLGFILYGVLASFLLTILLIFSFKKYFINAATRWKGDFFKSFGFGILYIVGVPVAIIVLFISIIGIPLQFAEYEYLHFHPGIRPQHCRNINNLLATPAQYARLGPLAFRFHRYRYFPGALAINYQSPLWAG
ncbi:MAG: hypothetical protein U5L96_06590 [Owenweeksia sp.]|nr:hypothetical protein [Owenweeksia sp.]